MMTLTIDRLLEVSPMNDTHKDQFSEILIRNPFFTDNVTRQALEYLAKWYLEEAALIGEKRAFWGVTYRILDDPTPIDIECIKGYLTQALQLLDEYDSYPSWWDGDLY